jgi:putative acetyltransferase
MLTIIEDDLSDQAVQDLLAFHLEQMHVHSPPGSVFALDLAGLRRADVTVWTARQADRIAGVGALRSWTDGKGEVKSMRTHPDCLRQGVASALLEHIIAVARRRNLKRLSLETGSGPAFEPALALYRRRGFVDGEAFGDYEKSAFNQFLHLAL